jgi:hypothetical protein
MAFGLAWLGAVAGPAQAVPAFAVQTGQPCQACHVGGLGPQLTPFGREFKLRGYTTRAVSWNVPLSAMAQASFVSTAKAEDPAGFSANNNVALDQFSLFFAGGFGQHVGAFIQTTYDGVAKAFHWDNLDVRATTSTEIMGANVLLGASLNNNPTVQDAWNTVPAWGFPYTTSTLASSPATAPLLAGALAQNTLGLTGYAWINSEFYLEGGAYGSPAAGPLISLGSDPTVPGDIAGLAPYGRVAFQKAVGPGTLELGAFGLQASIHPGRDRTTGLTDRYTDLGLDASYVATLPSSDVLTVNGRYMYEQQSLAASCVLDAPVVSGGGTDGAIVTTGAGTSASGCASNNLTDLRADASYYWRNKIGVTIQAFDTFGNANSIIYSGNRTYKPDSSGVMFQIDGTPFGGGGSPLGPRFNVRIGLQYTMYTKFNGAGSNWDGAGSNAGDNNTLRVFTWFAY